MLNVNCKVLLVFFVLAFTPNSKAREVSLPDIEIGAPHLTIKVGEPFVFRLTYTFEEPVVSDRTQGIVKEIWHSAYFRLVREDNGSLLGRHRVYDVTLKLQDAQGLEYAENFMVFYDYGRKKLFFDEPGTYTFQAEGWTKTSNPLSITVGPASKADKRAISLLSDPNDYKFLVDGSERFVYNRAERMSHLKAVVNKCDGTLLAKWAAARLGVEKAKELWKKYPSGEEFVAKYRRREIVEPLFENSYKYLREGLQLPDEVLTREEVLAKIISAEIVRGDYDKALAYASEMGEKYPQGRYGSRAADARIELEGLKKREQEQSQQALMEGLRRDWVLPVFVAGAVAIIGGGLVLVLLLRKKASSGSK